MWFTLPANTILYRATRASDTWDEVLQGFGAFFSSGGRYNVVDQPTVYASEDPLVALSEFGWHAAFDKCRELGGDVQLSYPLNSVGKLWQFKITTPLKLIDLLSVSCVHQFGFCAHIPYNPHPNSYAASCALSHKIREWVPPAPEPRHEGIIAPSIRTVGTHDYSPLQVILFVRPAPVVPRSLHDRGVSLDNWDIELEFRSATNNSPISKLTLDVSWKAPRYRLSKGSGSVPRYVKCPGRNAIKQNAWHALSLQYSAH